MARVPTIAEEDAKRPNRDRDCLVGERTRIVNWIKPTLARLGIRNFKPTLRKAAEVLQPCIPRRRSTAGPDDILCRHYNAGVVHLPAVRVISEALSGVAGKSCPTPGKPDRRHGDKSRHRTDRI